MVAEAWLIWGMIGRFKAGKVTLDLVVVITLAGGTGGSMGTVLVIALMGPSCLAFLWLVGNWWVHGQGVLGCCQEGMYQQDTVLCCLSLYIWKKVKP